MAHWAPITAAETQDMFAETMGALPTQAEMGNVNTILVTDLHDAHGNPFPREQLRLIQTGFMQMTMASLGLYSFPFERCKKIAFRYGQNIGADLFGLQQFDDDQRLLAMYPGTVVRTWNRPPNATPGWFAACLRNSFAHAQSRWTTVGGASGIVMWNATDPNTLNSDIFMTTDHFVDLVKTALQHCIAIVAPGGIYEPLTTLLNQIG